MHSENLGRLADYKNKRVCIVGLGESGSDITLEIARVASATCISTRNGPGYVISRYWNGSVADVDTSRCHHSLPKWFWRAGLLRGKLKLESLLNKKDTYDPKVESMVQKINQGKEEFSNCLGQPWRYRYGTKSTSFVEAIAYYQVVWKQKIDRLEKNRIIFKDGSDFFCDIILCCTGYKPAQTFLSKTLNNVIKEPFNPRKLYQRIILPDLGKKIGWIGFQRPGVGAVPPIIELEARYFALLIDGQKKLPSINEMRKIISEREATDLSQFPYDALQKTTLTDYMHRLTELSTAIGCEPSLRKLFYSDPKIWYKVMFGPINGAQFRLSGPGATPEQAKQSLAKIPLMPWPILVYEFTLLILAKIMYFIGFKSYKTMGA
ncbi:MAG: hypothetical protein AAF669_06530 [Pseudomonadota bacterium]